MKQKTDYQKQKSNSSSNLFQKGLFYFALVIFLGLTCWVFFFSGLLQIKKINFKEGISDEERLVFEKAIKEELKGNFLEFIPRNNLVLINCEKIEKKLEKQSKSIKKVVISKKFPDELILELTIREGQFIFCVQEKCFLVDNMGEAYFQLDNLELDEFKNSLAEIRLKGQRTIGVGERIISSEKAQIYSQLAGLSEREPEFGLKNIFRQQAARAGARIGFARQTRRYGFGQRNPLPEYARPRYLARQPQRYAVQTHYRRTNRNIFARGAV